MLQQNYLFSVYALFSCVIIMILHVGCGNECVDFIELQNECGSLLVKRLKLIEIITDVEMLVATSCTPTLQCWMFLAVHAMRVGLRRVWQQVISLSMFPPFSRFKVHHPYSPVASKRGSREKMFQNSANGWWFRQMTATNPHHQLAIG